MFYYLLKAANLVLTSVWSFTLIFVLVRVLPIADYANVAIVTGLGGYVLAVNLGFSTVVYSTLRKNYLTQGPQEEASISLATLVLYGSVAVLAATIFWGCVYLIPIGSGPMRGALVIHFAALACALPWMIVRVSTAAVDRYIAFESLEMVRRALALALVIAMLFGVTFKWYAILSLALWAIAFLATLPIMTRIWTGTTLRVGFRHLRREIVAVKSTGTFSLLETIIYNFPYLFVPILYKSSTAIVSFDTFYKIVRFGASAYLASAEATLPAQTRAHHEQDGGRLLRLTTYAILLAAIPMALGVISVTIFGDITFGNLLKKAGLISTSTRISMALMLIAMLFQTISGNLLINTGNAAALARISWSIAGALGLFSIVVAAIHSPFSTFIIGYSTIYCFGAAGYTLLLLAKIQALPARTPN
ncbi:hypothetical protein [Phenylobacterium aquaticum]|uniref:hypothetical protein n=1 Tax=Phenylobacterium aquaticum TaxID=1763816 RepID=UPI001F5DB26F|nr:hypothetical protein [Phenylobacterium aquaticum]MCI3132738.1 hypothetical protein [Phenylobacterium aquaticum]